MSQLWTILDVGTGAVLYGAFRTPSAGSHPKDNGWAWDATKHRCVRIDMAPVPATQSFVGDKWVDDAGKVETLLLGAVKVEAERRKMLAMSPGGAKKAEYAEKRAEVVAWDSLGGTASAILVAFNALPQAVRESRFGHAIADAAAFGDTPAAAIGRFRVGLGKAAAFRLVSALEAKVCADIRAATTVAGKRAAAAPLTGAQ